MTAEAFRCYLVTKSGKDRIEAGIEERPLYDLPSGEVLIRVAFSSLNYKDAMASTGHPGVVKNFPHVPGIDASGTVAEDTSGRFNEGDPVLVSGYGLGADRWGGWSEYIRVPADWAVPLPDGLSLEEAMIYGTAGFTAALSVRSLREHGITPEAGEVLVSGATGGVGVMAIKLLAKLGYTVVAVSGKQDKYGWLEQLGASRVVGRDEVRDASSRPLLSARWAAAVDTVGGDTLATILRGTRPGGCVTACGLVGGTDLSLTVYPFILRGIVLAGIDSAWCPRDRRIDTWNKLARDWKLDGLQALSNNIGLADVDAHVQEILSGRMAGRTVISVGSAT